MTILAVSSAVLARRVSTAAARSACDCASRSSSMREEKGTGQRLQLVHDPRAHLHHAMPVPQQLSEIPILRTRYPGFAESDLRASAAARVGHLRGRTFASLHAWP